MRLILLGSFLALGLVVLTADCFGEPTSGWRATGAPEKTFTAPTVGGRPFTIGVRDCVRVNGNENGVILSVYRPDRAVIRTCIASRDLPEFSDNAALGYRTLHLRGWGALGGWISSVADWARDAGGVIDRIVNSIRNISDAFKQLIKSIMKAFDEFSGRVSTELEALAGADASGDYAVNVKDSALFGGALSDRVFRALQSTATRPERVQAIASAIVAQPR